MSKPRLVALLDQIPESAFCTLPGASDFDIRFVPTGEPEALRRELACADAVWSSLRVPLTADLLECAGPRLRVVLTNSTGTDHLDLPALEARGIALISLKHDRAFLRTVTPTAELAFGLMLACMRRLPECIDASRRGDWARHRLGGHQVAGKTLGIIGVGRLGSMMATYAKAFRMRVLGYDPCRKRFPAGVTRVEWPTLLRKSDVLSVHAHLDETTRGMLDREAFARMKRGVILINTARGGLIDEAALIEAMQNGTVAAAGLDVIDGEWLPDKRKHPLIAYSRENPRLLITPHVGGTCPETVRRTCAHSMRKLAAFFQERPDLS